jgi:serine protease AprX
MAKSVGIDEQEKLEEATLRRFVFQTFGRARRTQDSPVMPDVWLRYIRVAERSAAAGKPAEPVDLLLTPWSGVRPGQIAKRLRESIAPGSTELGPLNTEQQGKLAPARIALSDSRVVACVDFETLVRNVVPLSGWWQRLFRSDIANQFPEKKLDNPTKEDLQEIRRVRTEVFNAAFARIGKSVANPENLKGFDVDLSRYAALVGFVDRLSKVKPDSDDKKKLAALAYRLGSPPVDSDGESEEIDERGSELSDEERDLLREVYNDAARLLRDAINSGDFELNGIYLISLNRPAAQSLFESRATVKADAAERVFQINTSGIVFAVVDGGIDAAHPAFLKDPAKEAAQGEDPAKGSAQATDTNPLRRTRVKETYDFTILRDLIAFAGILQYENADPATLTALNGPNKEIIVALASKKESREAFRYLAIRNNKARDLDWEIVRPMIRVSHANMPGRSGDGDKTKEYRLPGTDHGTHVAGILAADRPNDPDCGRDLKGMCPQLSLYDLRVFDSKGRGDEFAILCALEFVGWLNRDRSNPVVHGVNLSLALAHDVDSFACGQTPVCEACNHLVGAGTVVVAAAGNTGFEGGAGAKKQSFGTGYRPISITDPGNADGVITVGSTHRRDPHLYGVSYFSARGPTGDGRRKPDILAPGEKITSTVLNAGSRRMDGTSMAAPHVAGAAALLMARYPELIGRPARIKEILMKTATDLNRERSFQGAGLVDVLRALQSV